MSTTIRRCRSKLRELASGERGQALVFGALTVFMVAASVIFVADMGMVTSTRVQVQNAADECAYSGALYEANVISSVAYLNEAMAYLYYDGIRYAADTTMVGVLAGLKSWGPPYPSNKRVYEDKDEDPPIYAEGEDPIAIYNLTYDRAKEWIPQIEKTLNMFARWEWGMSLACSELVKMEIHRTALKHGIEAVAIYPDVDFFPANGVQFDLHILKLMEAGRHIGWRVWTDDPPFYVEARQLPPFDSPFFDWLITNTDGKTYEIQKTDDNTYRVRTDDQDITVMLDPDNPNKHVNVKLISTKDGVTETNIDARDLGGNLGWAVAMSNDDYSVDYTPKDGGGYTISVENHETGDSGTADIRRDTTTGHLQQFTNGEWADVPGQNDTVTVGGVDIPVQVDDRIDLGNDSWFRVPNELHLKDITYLIPNVFQMPNIWVTLQDDSVRIDAFIDIQTPGGSRRLRFTIDEKNTEEMILYGLMGRNYTVPDTNDCKWYASEDGNERDRMCRDCQLLVGHCDPPESEETEWTYQYRLGKPYFIKEDLRRFGHHAIEDRDVYALSHNFEYPQWAEWYDIAQGQPNGSEYYQTRPQWGAPANYDYDGDGTNDSVRIYASDTLGLNSDDSRDFDPYYKQVKPWTLHDVAEASSNYAPPVRLSEDFFYYALTVGCWRSHGEKGEKSRSTPLALFQNSSWGVVGAASARAGFLETYNDVDTSPVPGYRFTWQWPQDVEHFVNAGYENLYEPVWTAHLWPMTDAIKSEHLDAYVDNQTGISYLLYGLMHTAWYVPREPAQIGEEPTRRDDVPRALSGMGLDTDSPRIGEVLTH